MHKPDFEEFRALLITLAKTFGKPPPDNDSVQAYWHALKDQTIQSVKRCAEHHTRYGKFYPKPAELRPKDDKPDGGVRDDGAFKAAIEAAKRMAAQQLASGDGLAIARAHHARLTRLMITTHESDPAYPEIRADWHRNGDLLTSLHGICR